MKKIVFFLFCLVIMTMGLSAADNSEQLLKELGIKMVNIPGKNFEMSSTEITQKTYKAIMGENPSNFKGENLPVEKVNWYDAIAFCNNLSKRLKLTPVYTWNSRGTEVYQDASANGFRLPTDEEWDYAAEGGKDYTYSGSNNIDDVAWYKNNSNDMTHPVAQKKPNDYGLFDMSGNVREWCWDSNWKNPILHSVRGGCWVNQADACEVYSGYWINAVAEERYMGFRVVRTIKPE